MPSMKKKTVEKILTDPSAPMKMRVEMLRHVCHAEEEEVREKVLSGVLEAAGQASAGQQFMAKTQELTETLRQLQEGPLRCATFDRLIESELLGRRAQVILQDGTAAFCSVPDAKLTDALRCGDTVWLDGQGRALLFHQPEPVTLGEEARLERCLPEGDVEVSVSELSRLVCRPSARLREQIERGEAGSGSTVVVCPRRMMAFHALPASDGLSHMRFLSREPVPDVIAERDIGAPPGFIERLAAHVRRELEDPSLGRRYRLRRGCLHLAVGVPGSGKTLSIHALWRRIYEIMAEVTGVPIEDLPQRVLQLRSADVLSKWVGESDRNIARFFDEVEQIAGETFETPDGRVLELPVLVIAEEIDALARQRGSDAIHDRIQATLLTSLDPARSLFRDRLVLVLCTTNAPGLVDAAFRRRAGGTVSRFERMDRFSFRAVLQKHLRGRPFRRANGTSEEEQQRRIVADLTAWLFAPNGSDPGQVEITFVGQPNPVIKHRRDFLTGGLVDRAIQEASLEACEQEWRGAEEPGLSMERVMCAVDAQVRHIVDQLTPGNCEQYLTLPDAMRVGTVRRLPQAPVLPIQLERPH
jgi:ATP-dependent 26S proteasome regulatory subunit